MNVKTFKKEIREKFVKKFGINEIGNPLSGLGQARMADVNEYMSFINSVIDKTVKGVIWKQ